MITRPTGIETRRKVLLVDDDAVSLELMSLLLAHEGHQVVRASGAEDALELLSTEPAARPDVLLVDLQMPGVSGGQLAERVRAMQGPEPLLLAMSATEVQRQQIMAFDGFLLKPLALDELRQALRSKKFPDKNGGRTPEVRPANPRNTTLNSAREETREQVLDPAVIRKLLTMMPVEALHEVIAACIADTRASAEVLRGLLKKRDEAGLRQCAHRIKGAALMIGATRIARLAAGLETWGNKDAANPAVTAGLRAGGNKEAATPAVTAGLRAGGNKDAATPMVLDDLVSACSELERMLLAGKLKHS